MNFRYLYTSFDGRINRRPFWLASLLLIVAAIAISFVTVVPVSAASRTLGSGVSLILSLVLLFPATALGAKRLHDRGKSGSLMAVFVAPGLISQAGDLLGLTSNPQMIAGQVIHLPNTLGWIINLIVLAVAIWALIELGLLRGTTGPNAYGNDPLADDLVQPALGELPGRK
jgi:uncharacterized membrane protein YhaH (DUF805 family)